MFYCKSSIFLYEETYIPNIFLDTSKSKLNVAYTFFSKKLHNHVSSLVWSWQATCFFLLFSVFLISGVDFQNMRLYAYFLLLNHCYGLGPFVLHFGRVVLYLGHLFNGSGNLNDSLALISWPFRKEQRWDNFDWERIVWQSIASFLKLKTLLNR